MMPLVSKGRARLITLFVLFTCCLNPQPFTLAGFQAGAAGHRAWDILLTLLLFGAAARLLAGCSRSIWLGALAIGGLVALAIEGLPLIACTVLLGVLISQFLHRSVIALRFAALFALGSLFGSLLLLADHPPAAYFTVSFAEPSIIGPLLTGCAALLFTGQYVALRYLHQRRELALFALLAVAAALTAVLIHYFPQMLAGAGAGLSPAERQLAASSHAEAMRLRQVATSLADYLRLITPSLLGLLGIGLAIERSKLLQTDEKLAQRRIPLLLFYGGLTVASFLIASRYARYYPYAELCACPWLLWLWQFFSGRLAAGEWRGVQRTLFYLALGPLPLLVWPAMLVDASFRSNVLLFPTSQQVATDKCEIGPVADWVDRQFGPDTLMLVPLNASDRFLFRTQVKLMFLASFPSQDRFIDATTFYDTFDPDAAKAIAKRHRLDAVAICKDYYPLNANSAFEDRLLRGHIRFGRQLATGTVPDWLIPVPIPVDTPYLFFKIDHSRL